MIKAINSKLGLLENPSENGWFNAYDERDIVALNPLDREHFPVDPYVKNFNEVDNQTDNRHGIVGYLNSKEVASQVAQYLS